MVVGRAKRGECDAGKESGVRPALPRVGKELLATEDGGEPGYTDEGKGKIGEDVEAVRDTEERAHIGHGVVGQVVGYGSADKEKHSGDDRRKHEDGMP